MPGYTHVIHGFDPIYDKNSRVLVLGSVPSVRSRENNFYYGHPQNRFWKVLSAIADLPPLATTEEKTAALKANGIALWDAAAECDIVGSSDSSIKNVRPTDLSKILDTCDILRIYANGAAAAKLFNKYQRPLCGRDIITLPSTSPANAAWTFDRLLEAWRCILD